MKGMGNGMTAIWMMILTVIGLCIFEVVSSLDNAVINAEVLSTMSEKARKWFQFWGILSAVFVVRGVLPLLIVWFASPGISLMEAMTATFSNDGRAADAIHRAAPTLLCGGAMFLLLLFLYWLFMEKKKQFGLPGEEHLSKMGGIAFYSIVTAIAFAMTWYSGHLAFSAFVGTVAYFIAQGLKIFAEKVEKSLSGMSSDIVKILFLEMIDLCFSIDGVIGAFGFTMNVVLILIGNGVGALVVRHLTITNVDRIKKYPLLKNGAMYAIGFLSIMMLLEAFHIHVPMWVTPSATMMIVGYFFWLCFKRPYTEPEPSAVLHS